MNLERLAEREALARQKEAEYRLRRLRESKAFHSAQDKAHQKRLLALGQIVEDLWPDKGITDISSVLHGMSWNEEPPTRARSSHSHKKDTSKDYSDTAIIPEARDEVSTNGIA